MSDRVFSEADKVADHRPSLSAAQVYSDQPRNFDYARYTQHDRPSGLPNLEITNQYAPTDPPEIRVPYERQNAREQMPTLMRKSGAVDKGRDGLGKEELDALARRTDLTEKEMKAVRFLRDNFDELSTRRFLEDVGGATNWGPFGSLGQRRRITEDSFDRNKADAVKPVDPIEQKWKGDGPMPKVEPRGSAPEPAEPPDQRRNDPRRGRDRAMADEVVVQPNWGWWQIARENLRRQGIHQDLDGSVTRNEMARIQQLNPDVTMLRPDQRIRVR